MNIKQRFFLIFILLSTIALSGCQKVVSIEESFMGDLPDLLGVNIEKLASGINSHLHEDVPRVDGKAKLRKWEAGYQQVLLLVEGEEEDKPQYFLTAEYDTKKKLKSIYYKFDYALEDEGQTKPTDLMYSLFIALGVDDDLFEQALLASVKENTVARGIFYELTINLNEETGIGHVRVHGVD